MKKKSFYQLVHLPRIPNSQGWVKSNPGARNSVQAAVWAAENRVLEPLTIVSQDKAACFSEIEINDLPEIETQMVLGAGISLSQPPI